MRIAKNCTLKEDAARKVERAMSKRIAAVALQQRVGETFSAVVTGAGPKGVFVRVLGPPVEGMLVQGQQGADVGDRISETGRRRSAARVYRFREGLDRPLAMQSISTRTSRGRRAASTVARAGGFSGK